MEYRFKSDPVPANFDHAAGSYLWPLRKKAKMRLNKCLLMICTEQLAAASQQTTWAMLLRTERRQADVAEIQRRLLQGWRKDIVPRLVRTCAPYAANGVLSCYIRGKGLATTAVKVPVVGKITVAAAAVDQLRSELLWDMEIEIEGLLYDNTKDLWVECVRVVCATAVT